MPAAPAGIVGRHCCIISEQHVSDEGFTNLCLDSDAAKIEKPAIWSGPQTDSPGCCAKGVSQDQGKDFEERWGQDAPLFGAAADVKGHGGATVELLCLCGRIQSCSAILVGSRSLEASGRDRLC